jgi:succinate-acetate transporter protein
MAVESTGPGAVPAGRRGADVERAPAAAAPAAGWTPADPGPLGLAAFALTTFVLSVFNAGLVSRGAEPVVLPLALFYGGLAQLLAGMWEFRTGNTFGAVAFTSYAAFWLAIWGVNHLYVATILKTGALNVAHGVGLFLWAWAIFTVYMTIASLRTSAAIAVTFVLLSVTFILLAIGNSGAHTNIVKAGGWFGIATAIAAWYASMAAVVNATFGRTMLPVVPLRR